MTFHDVMFPRVVPIGESHPRMQCVVVVDTPLFHSVGAYHLYYRHHYY